MLVSSAPPPYLAAADSFASKEVDERASAARSSNRHRHGERGVRLAIEPPRGTSTGGAFYRLARCALRTGGFVLCRCASESAELFGAYCGKHVWRARRCAELFFCFAFKPLPRLRCANPRGRLGAKAYSMGGLFAIHAIGRISWFAVCRQPRNVRAEAQSLPVFSRCRDKSATSLARSPLAFDRRTCDHAPKRGHGAAVHLYRAGSVP